MGASPFNVAYGTEMMILLEIGLSSARVEQYNEPNNSEYRRTDLDLLPEVRQQAQVRMTIYRQRIAWYYNAKVKPKAFHPEDLILRKAEVSKSLDLKKFSKLGSYRIIETLRSDTYQLETLDGTTISQT